MNNLTPKKIFTPIDKEPEFMNDWVLLRHGELDKNYSATLKEQELYCFSELELKILLKETFYKGQDYECAKTGCISLQDYLQSLNIK